MTSLVIRRARQGCAAVLAALLTMVAAPAFGASAPARGAAAPAKPPADALAASLATIIAMERRVAPIVQRLAVDSARWCPVTMAMPGWLLGDRRLYRDAIWPRVRAAYGAGDIDAPFIAALDPAGPAARAGLRPGDAISAINGQPVVAASADPHARMAAAHALLAALPADASFSVTTPRMAMPLTITPARGCASEFRVEAADNVHAKADGLLVLISAGMVRFADADDELATVIAHELAHNILRHRARLDEAAITRGLAQLFGRNARLTRITEAEADQLSVWLLSEAGYDPAAAVRFWTNYGKRHGGGIFQSPTHPTWRQRVAGVRAETALLARLRAADPAAPPPMIANPAPLD